jgi:predicted NUDIX family NTP pyrophosphohydrolase
MTKQSAGLLVYRFRPKRALEVFLVHPGGPFWSGKDAGAWSIPKGLVEEGEDGWDAARREFAEEVGCEPPVANPIALTPVTQRSGKVIHAWAVEGDLDPARLRSNTFSMEWPPRSGRQREFPEVDRAAWFPLSEARRCINPGQAPLLEALERLIEKAPRTP